MARGKHERVSRPIGTKKNKNKFTAKRVIMGVLTITLLAVILVQVFAFIDTGFISSVNKLNLNIMSVVYGRNDKGEFAEYEYISSSERRVWASLEEISPDFGNAFVAIEDERFYKHSGIDIKRTLGALFNEFFGESTYGGSTITQQLVKNITGDKERSYLRKVREITRSIALETKLSKDEILEMYMNTIYLGEGCYGVETASNFYFGKSADELTLAQCACIAGITQYPSVYDPLINPDKNKEKQKLVLSKMLELGYINQEEYDEAIDEKLDFSKAGKSKVLSNQSYFVDQVIEDVINDLQVKKGYSKNVASKMVYGGGLKIYATVNPKIQSTMEDIFENEANFPSTYGSTKPEAAMVVSDVTTGEVVGIIGGRGEKSQDRVLNRATHTTRQPGSVIKPVAVYGPAIDVGNITNSSIVVDEKVDYGGWSPKNYYSGFYGSMTVRRAVELSSNIPAVKVLEQLGVEKSFEYMTNRLNFSTLVESEKKSGSVYTDKNLSSLALGGLTNGVKVIELNAAYNTIANGGIYMEPVTYSKVLDADDNIILENDQKVNVAFGEDTAFLTTQLLKSVVDNGTGVGAKISGMDTCGKTGTTDDDNDRWFAGYTPYYTGTVWFGYDTPRTVVVSGANPALTLWKKVMTRIHSGYASKTFTKPDTVESVYVCTATGNIAGEKCTSYMEYFAKSKAPSKHCNGVHGSIDESITIDISGSVIDKEPTYISPEVYGGDDTETSKPNNIINEDNVNSKPSTNSSTESKPGTATGTSTKNNDSIDLDSLL